MIGKVTVKSWLPFELNGSQPKALSVVDTSPSDSATRLYSVVADYGWAERILCSGCYANDANDIASSIAGGLLIPDDRVTLAERVWPKPVAANPEG